ncbi:MAG: amidophosphoribosyltransferase, partial [Prochlorotrichaceae cyanobacterium]
YYPAFVRNHYIGRTFIQPTQMIRDFNVRVKLNLIRSAVEGKRVVVVDDSIVRGTTSRKLVTALRKAGAKEVHMRISSPPVTHPCFYGIDTDNQDQLVAANLTLEGIVENIGVDSLGYLSIPGMLKAAQDDDRNFCKACFTGDYPVAVPEGLKRSKLKLETLSSAT